MPVPLCDDGRLQRQLGRRHLLSSHRLTLVQTPHAGASRLVARRRGASSGDTAGARRSPSQR